MTKEDEFKALEDRVTDLEALVDRVTDLERDYAELRAKMTPAKIGALVDKYVKEQTWLAERTRG